MSIPTKLQQAALRQLLIVFWGITTTAALTLGLIYLLSTSLRFERMTSNPPTPESAAKK